MNHYLVHPFFSKWKAGKSSINRVAVTPSGKNLLSAGMVIKLWDLETKKELMVNIYYINSILLMKNFSGVILIF